MSAKSMSTAITNCDLGAGRLQSIVIDSATGQIDAVEPNEVAAEHVLDAQGCAVVAGLTDHHLHLHALAASVESVPCGPPSVTNRGGLSMALRGATPDSSEWVRGIGYTESVAGELTSSRLDELIASPTRIQHRSGALWMLNTAAATAVGLDTAHHRGIERDDRGHATGRIWRADSWLRQRLPPAPLPDLAAVGRELDRMGIVEVTDATPNLDDSALDSFIQAVGGDALRARLCLLGAPLGSHPRHDRITFGAYKLVIADSDIPDPDALAERIRESHAANRPVAVHCVSQVALAVLLAAWRSAGTRPGDRIEHGSIIPAETISDLAALGVGVVTQPGFRTERGEDYLNDTRPDERDGLYRVRSLIDAGIPLALSSDAPYGPLSPWQGISAATTRRTATGRLVAGAESISVETALGRYQRPAGDIAGRARAVRPGARADLVLLDRPWADVIRDPAATNVEKTIIDGKPG